MLPGQRNTRAGRDCSHLGQPSPSWPSLLSTYQTQTLGPSCTPLLKAGQGPSSHEACNYSAPSTAASIRAPHAMRHRSYAWRKLSSGSHVPKPARGQYHKTVACKRIPRRQSKPYHQTFLATSDTPSCVLLEWAMVELLTRPFPAPATGQNEASRECATAPRRAACCSHNILTRLNMYRRVQGPRALSCHAHVRHAVLGTRRPLDTPASVYAVHAAGSCCPARCIPTRGASWLAPAATSATGTGRTPPVRRCSSAGLCQKGPNMRQQNPWPYPC